MKSNKKTIWPLIILSIISTAIVVTLIYLNPYVTLICLGLYFSYFIYIIETSTKPINKNTLLLKEK